MKKIILADFANDLEYHQIKDPHGTAFATLELHRTALQTAVETMTAQGYAVEIEICDLAGYTEFCKLQNAVNTPQTVAAYVVMKNGGAEKKIHPGLEHQNITIHAEDDRGKNAAAFRDLCRATGMTKQALAEICGKTPATFSRYCSGICPVPRLVWEKVKEFVIR